MSQSPKNYLNFKLDDNSNFITINQNTNSLIQYFQYEETRGENRNLNSSDNYSKSNNNSLSPDEGICTLGDSLKIEKIEQLICKSNDRTGQLNRKNLS